MSDGDDGNDDDDFGRPLLIKSIHEAERWRKSARNHVHFSLTKDMCGKCRTYFYGWNAMPSDAELQLLWTLAIWTTLMLYDILVCGFIMMTVIWCTHALRWFHRWRIYCMLALLSCLPWLLAGLNAYVRFASALNCCSHAFRNSRNRFHASTQHSLLDLLPFPSKIIYKSTIIYTLLDQIVFNLMHSVHRSASSSTFVPWDSLTMPTGQWTHSLQRPRNAAMAFERVAIISFISRANYGKSVRHVDQQSFFISIYGPTSGHTVHVTNMNSVVYCLPLSFHSIPLYWYNFRLNQLMTM